MIDRFFKSICITYTLLSSFLPFCKLFGSARIRFYYGHVDAGRNIQGIQEIAEHVPFANRKYCEKQLQIFEIDASTVYFLKPNKKLYRNY